MVISDASKGGVTHEENLEKADDVHGLRRNGNVTLPFRRTQGKEIKTMEPPRAVHAWGGYRGEEVSAYASEGPRLRGRRGIPPMELQSSAEPRRPQRRGGL